MRANLKIKTIITLLSLTFMSCNVFALNDVNLMETKEAVESEASDDIEQNLGKISLLKSKLEIIKLEKSIEKEKSESYKELASDYGMSNNYNNSNYNNPNYNNYGQQSPIPTLPDEDVVNSNNTASSNIEKEILRDDMTAIAVYGLGNMSYAEILVNGGKVIVKNGEVLSNGYKVKSLSNIGVVLEKGDDKITLPITASTLSK